MQKLLFVCVLLAAGCAFAPRQQYVEIRECFEYSVVQVDGQDEMREEPYGRNVWDSSITFVPRKLDVLVVPGSHHINLIRRPLLHRMNELPEHLSLNVEVEFGRFYQLQLNGNEIELVERARSAIAKNEKRIPLSHLPSQDPTEFELVIEKQEDLGEKLVRKGKLLRPVTRWSGWEISFGLTNTSDEEVEFFCRGKNNPSIVWRDWSGEKFTENRVDYWCGTGVEICSLAPGETLRFSEKLSCKGEMSIGMEIRFPKQGTSTWVWSDKFFYGDERMSHE